MLRTGRIGSQAYIVLVVHAVTDARQWRSALYSYSRCAAAPDVAAAGSLLSSFAAVWLRRAFTRACCACEQAGVQSVPLCGHGCRNVPEHRVCDVDGCDVEIHLC